MRASVLAVGTELTAGQIINKNATWISSQLKAIGILTEVHLVVPDDRKLILEGLDFCAQRSDVIFVTGGLGPTSDDFTRELVAEWAGLKLEFDPESWVAVQERLSSRGFPVQEIQKQQCFFPTGSKVLKNTQGTANGFSVNAKSKGKDKQIFGLPGPPREIEAIWITTIKNWLELATANLDKHQTFSWDTLGLGESQVADLVEKAVSGHQFEIGYRVHLPYVEVKLSFFESQRNQAQIWIDKIEQALSKITVGRQGADAAQIFASGLEKYPQIEIFDAVSGSFLMGRWWPLAKDWMKRSRWQVSSVDFLKSPPLKSQQSLLLYLAPVDEFSCEVGLVKPGGEPMRSRLTTQIKSPLMHERRQQYFAELALLFWSQNLSS